MAEAVVEERTSPPTRFYCHMCNLEINIFTNDYTCPLCSDGFIEELPPLTPGESGSSVGLSGSTTSGSNASSDMPLTVDSLIDAIIQHHSRGGRNIDGTPNIEISIDGSPGGGETSSTGSGTGNRGGSNNRRSVVTGNGGGTGPGINVGRQRQTNFHRLDNVFLEFLSSLSGGDDGMFGNSQMFFMGNPGDYAWGREGIDTVVTQLLNHMDTSGPPPLPKEKIAEIPTVEISEGEVEQKLKCSVCWEDFKLQEAVRKLPCLHVYHENCIVPWLDLHGTCPICRKSLQLEPSTSCSMHNGSPSTSGHVDLTVPLAPTVSLTVSTSQPGTSATAVRSSTNTHTQPMDTSSGPPPLPRQAAQAARPAAGSSSQSTNPLAFEDGNIEYDFD